MRDLLNCKKATTLISESMDRKLSVRERIALWSHLYLCNLCRRFRTNLKLLQKLVREIEYEEPPPAEENLSDEAKERMRAAMKRSQ